MTQFHTVRGRSTSVAHLPSGIVVTYHHTAVVIVTPKTITLNSAGWRTYTTKARMNQAANQFGLGYQVYQKDHEWFVSYRDRTLPFVDGMELAR